jgi:hypothetical protein
MSTADDDQALADGVYRFGRSHARTGALVTAKDYVSLVLSQSCRENHQSDI